METLFGKKKHRPRQSSVSSPDGYEKFARPFSVVSTSTTRSESNRSSRYAPSLSPFESQSSHHHLSQFTSYHKHPDEFFFPRPDHDEEIEALFENTKRVRDLGDLSNLSNLSIDQKWNIVYSSEQIRWKDEKIRDEQARKQTDSGQAAPIVENTPEWYIQKFLDKTITAKQASSLHVSLRSRELS